MSTAPTVLKLGGELLESPDRLAGVADAIVRAGSRVPLIVVHGGGREIDAALAAAGIPKTQVDGVRVTDAATLGVVVAVLAGTINTRFVAAIAARGGRPVGLTGADAGVAPVVAMAPLRAVDGRVVPLGFVGQPVCDGQAALLAHLVTHGYVPVIASVAADAGGTLYNVNADGMAAGVAIRAGAWRLVIAGTTPGVLDDAGRNIPVVNAAREADLVRAGTVSAGMLAKLKACREALAGGVRSVLIADGREPERLAGVLAADWDHQEDATAVVA